MQELRDRAIVYILGAPGAGKGTQCSKIKQQYDWEHLSTGDLLREEVESGSEQGKDLQKLMDEGEIVPSHITLGLLERAIKGSKKRFILIDGFPRQLDQMHEFEERLCKAAHCLAFMMSQEEATERILKRGETSGRSDDNEETVEKRFQVFESESKPVIEALKAEGRVTEIPSGRSIEEIWEDVKKIVDRVVAARSEKGLQQEG